MRENKKVMKKDRNEKGMGVEKYWRDRLESKRKEQEDRRKKNFREEIRLMEIDIRNSTSQHKLCNTQQIMRL